ncbi:MAG: hypothetical protein JNM00_02595, partial [Flavobacteriales bacterium]|nr:hypothetical protein [Flavobacteriales bacterium]
LEEFDSFGDGWDNAVFNIYDYTGALVSSQTLEVAGGTYGVDLLCLPDGCYTYEVTSGFFPSEISWNLYYANEGTLSGTANQSGSFTVGSPTYGCTDPFACNYNFASNCDDGSCVYCPEYCLALDMTDSYGDGWNGAAYNVYNVYGALVASGTLDFFYGSNEIAGLCLGSGCYTLEVTSGSFPSEIGWTLYGANEGTLSGGASSNVSFSIGLPVIGCLDPFACNYNSDATCDDGNCVYCPEYCVSIDMADSFGDGWNGAGYAVYNANGIQIASGTLDFGYNYNEIEAICLPAGCYTLEVSAGSFPSEIGWTLNGANEGVLSGGASTTVSFTVGAPVYGCLDVAACNYNPAATCDDASCVYCLENCVAITMTDSYGDGWDGASYTVYSNDGLAVANGTLDFAYGGVEVEAICLPDGCYTMDVTGGSFPSEVGWTLNGTNESPISGGANTSIAFTVGTVVSGCTDAAAGNYNPAANCEDGSCTYGCFGDFDDNGVINVSDLLLFMANFGCTTACGEYDLDGNTVVNVNDLLLFMAIFGTVCP